MRTLLLVVLLMAASPASADVVDNEIDDAECESGRAVVVDHGRTMCLEPNEPASGGCEVARHRGSFGALVGALAFAVVFAPPRRRRR